MHVPLASHLAVGNLPGIKEAQLLKGPDSHIWLLWLEQRPQEEGRTTALIRPFGKTNQLPQELTPNPINLRSGVHGYGGGVIATAIKEEILLMTWIDNGCIWRQNWQLPEIPRISLQPLEAPIRLSCPGDWDLANGLLDLRRQCWIGVREINGKDQLVSVKLNENDLEPDLLHQPADFAGYACLSVDGNQLAWVEWQQPDMPWESSQLFCSELSEQNVLSKPILLAGGEGVSVFQPQWLPNGELLVTEDSSGWWNLMIRHPHEANWENLWPMEAETAMPQWVYGMSTTAWDGNYIIAATCANGSWSLKRLGLDGHVETIDQPFNEFTGLQALEGRAVAVASSDSICKGLLEMDFREKNQPQLIHSPAVNLQPLSQNLSKAEPIWFAGYENKLTHAWYYPPKDTISRTAPLLVKSHSGPTGMAYRGLSLPIQYWTSRGWAVVDVNYGGSTGFGREYRERLKGGWGIVDVADCAGAARYLIEEGKVDPKKIAIEGGSAGGFTTLSCLCFTDIFSVGACRYAVSDLTDLVKNTHRFETHYLDSLIGEWPKQKNIYTKRSPLNHVEKINCPVIFFQGLQDKVVPPHQTEVIANALRKNGVPVEVRIFKKEGHGFRDRKTQIEVLEQTETFFRHHLELKT